MKKIINGKMYDTNTARFCGRDSYSNSRDFNHWTEELYLKKTGEYFLWGEGGPMTKYARSCGLNEWRGGEAITPLTKAEARKWAEAHLTVDEYITIFE